MSRASRRRERQVRREKASRIPRLPWRNITNPYPPIEVLSADQVEAIHEASLRVLSEIGMKVLGSDARRRFAAAGAGRGDFRPVSGYLADSRGMIDRL